MTDAPDPTHVVPDVDVLAADLLVGGPSREAMELLRSHDVLTLVTSDALATATRRLIATLTDESLATDWERRFLSDATVVTPTIDGHPALAAAKAGNAATVLSLDATLQSAAAGVAIRPHVDTSVKAPAAFCRLLDAETLDSLDQAASDSGT